VDGFYPVCTHHELVLHPPINAGANPYAPLVAPILPAEESPLRDRMNATDVIESAKRFRQFALELENESDDEHAQHEFGTRDCLGTARQESPRASVGEMA